MFFSICSIKISWNNFLGILLNTIILSILKLFVFFCIIPDLVRERNSKSEFAEEITQSNPLYNIQKILFKLKYVKYPIQDLIIYFLKLSLLRIIQVSRLNLLVQIKYQLSKYNIQCMLYYVMVMFLNTYSIMFSVLITSVLLLL